MKIDTATFRLERVNEAVGYLQTEIDDLEAIGSLDAMLSPPLETARVNCKCSIYFAIAIARHIHVFWG